MHLTDGDFTHPSVQCAIWGIGGVSVPLCVKATSSEIEYFAHDAQADLIVTQPQYVNKFEGLNNIPMVVLD